MNKMKELEDMKKKHKLKDDFLQPKPLTKRNYGAKGKSEPLLGNKSSQKEEQVFYLYNNSINLYLTKYLVCSLPQKWRIQEYLLF